jgi:hypothetical protein
MISRKERYIRDKEKERIKQKEYYYKNKNKILQWNVEYRASPSYYKKFNKYYNERLQNPIHRLEHNLRNRIKIALLKGYKKGSAVKDLGCSSLELKIYLENKFKKGMSWENYGRGKGKWHIDHIKPLSKFDLTDRQQFLEGCHYSNLQPLWAEENISKGNNL